EFLAARSGRARLRFARDLRAKSRCLAARRARRTAERAARTAQRNHWLFRTSPTASAPSRALADGGSARAHPAAETAPRATARFVVESYLCTLRTARSRSADSSAA